jgi:predicted TIM-barrel fold metal-dependent hydrolase
MALRFLDANVVVGLPRNQGLFTPLATPAELRAYLSATGLAGALVWHWAQADGHPEAGNPLVEPFRQAAADVWVCWSVLPPLTGEQGNLVERLRAAKVAGVRLFPQQHRYPMNRVAWGDLLEAFSAARLPVLLSLEQGCSYDLVYGLLADYPQLTCILCDIGTWSMDRFTYPLLERYPNVHLETGMLSITDGGVEAAVARFGARRLVFGSGFPKRYAEAAMLQLIHAAISVADREAIAAGNLSRLLKETHL